MMKSGNEKFRRSELPLFFLLIMGIMACGKDEMNSPSITDNLPDISGYPIVGTNQSTWYGNITEISSPNEGGNFFGQNANYPGKPPQYRNNGDGTVTDLVTGLMWTQTSDMNGDGLINYADKMSQYEAEANASEFNLGGYTDWRLPGIKEQYSLIMFSGKDPSGYEGSSTGDLVPFINTSYFAFAYGDVEAGERIIDAQFATTTIYSSTTMGGAHTMFGVNLADGRIKGYPTDPMPGKIEEKQFYVMYVRGNPEYGNNNFKDNGDGTITDQATGLMWMQNDNATGMLWENALSYAENFEFSGYTDWRLPDVKELQSIVDYSRSPSSTNSPAIDPAFNCTPILNEAGQEDYCYYWSSTTHASWQENRVGSNAAYVSFGRAMGYMNEWQDVHGAGSQRSDPKTGVPADYPNGYGPQGDAIRIYNFVRLVRNTQ